MGAYGRATTAGPLLDPSVREALAGRHILIAEDNEVNQQVAREMLEQVGMRVTIAENGRRAIEILTAGEAVFDAVLMDLQMPEVDGLTAARRSEERRVGKECVSTGRSRGSRDPSENKITQAISI